MKFRDLSSYIKQLTNSAIVYNQDLELLTKSDLLLKELYGSFGDSEGFLKGELLKLSSFAEDSQDQVFYEFLQNAKDSGGSGLWVFTDPKLGVLILNDGDPFHTNPKEVDGSLFSFLGKGKGTKFKDSTKSGKKGVGSKLLYNLLVPHFSGDNLKGMSERLADILSKDLVAPILFSWSKKDFGALRRLVNVNQLEELEIGDEVSPILCKLFLSYFPALPKQVVNYEGEEIVPFGQKEFDQFKKCLSNALNEFNSDELFYSPGTIIYIPSPESTVLRLEKGIDEILQGLSQSLSVLSIDKEGNKVRRINIGGRKIVSDKFQSIPIKIPSDEKEIEASVIFSVNRNEGQKKLSNIFTDYFPVSKEVHGLGYILRCKDFDILDNRQKLRSEENKFKAFATKLKENWDEIPESKYGSFIGSIAISDDPNDDDEILFFHGEVKKIAVSNVPILHPSLKRAKADEIFVLPAGFHELDTSELLTNRFLLHPSLLEFFKDGLDRWGVEEYSLTRLFYEAGADRSKSFFSHSENYIRIIDQFEAENERELLLGIPFIPFTNGYLSIKELCENKDAFLDFPQNQFGSFKRACKNENVSINFSKGIDKFLNLDYYPNIKSLIESKWDINKIFERVNDFFNNSEISISNDLRNVLISLLYTNSKERFKSWVSNEFPKFSNRRGESEILICKTLGEGITNEFFNDWKLPVEQELSFLKEFQASETDFWKIISEDKKYLVGKIQALEKEGEIQPILTLISNIYNNRAPKEFIDKFFNSEDNIVFVDKDHWGDFNNVIFLKGLSTISEKEFFLIRNFFSKNNLQLPNSELLDVYGTRNFFELFYVKSGSQLNLNWVSISVEEIKVLKKINDFESVCFFDNFKIKEGEDGGLLIGNCTSSSIQFFNSNSIEVSEFLNEQSLYFELPKSLVSFFNKNDGLFDVETEQFKEKLLLEFGAEKRILSLFQNSSDQLKNSYIDKLEMIEIDSSLQEELKSDGFEVRLVKAFGNNETLLPKLKDKIQIDGQTISHDGFIDKVNVNSHHYFLSELLEDHGGAISRIKKATKLFSPLSEYLREKLFGLGDKPLSEIKDEVLIVDVSKPVHVAFLIDFLEQSEEDVPGFALEELPDFMKIGVQELFTEFKNRDINWKKYWEKDWFGLNPGHQIFPSQKEYWLNSELIPEDLLEWSKKSGDNSKYLTAKLDNQSHVEKSESFRLSFIQGEVLDDIYLSKKMWSRAFEWGIPREIDLIEKEGEKLWTIIEKQGLWESFSVSYKSWGERDERTLRLSKVGPSIKYYFDGTSHFEYLSMSELSPGSVANLSTSSSSKRRKYAKQLNLEQLSIQIRAKGDLPDKIEWEAGYYNRWKDNRPVNHYTYRIYTVNGMIESSAVIIKSGESFMEINSVKDEPRLRVKKEGNRRDLFIYPGASGTLSLKHLEEFQNDLFVGESESKDLVRLFSLANEFQEEALFNLKANGLIDENFNPISQPVAGNDNPTSNGNVYLEGLENLSDPNLLLENWELIKQLIGKFGKDVGKKLQEAIENETDDSKPNKLSGFIGEQLAKEWFEKNYQKNATWLGDSYLAYDITLGKNDLIEIKTKVKTLYDESVGGSGTTAVYLRQSQLNFIEDTKDKQYYLCLISLEDIGVKEKYYNWYDEWGREEPIQMSLQEDIIGFAKAFMNDHANMNLFSETIRFIYMKNGKDQVSVD